MLLNTPGDELRGAQRAALEGFVRGGGGVVAVPSGAPLPCTSTNGYTHAVEKATMRESRNVSATVNGTATTSNGDYIAKTGTLTFAPGETTKTITIEVKGDSKREGNETFYLDLFGLSPGAPGLPAGLGWSLRAVIQAVPVAGACRPRCLP